MAMSNLELQAILDASDSDSSQDNGDILASILKDTRGTRTHTRPSKKSHLDDANVDVDLERILREHDDDDDDIDDNEVLGYSFGGGGPRHSRNLSIDDHHSLGGSTISTRPNLFQSSPTKESSSSHSRMNVNMSNVGDLDVEEDLDVYNRNVSPMKQRSQVYDMPRVRKLEDHVNANNNTNTNTNEENYRYRSRNESLSSKSSPSTLISRPSGPTVPRNNQNPEEWMMLQKILNEADDDDDDDDDYNDITTIDKTSTKNGRIDSAFTRIKTDTNTNKHLYQSSEMQKISEDFKFGEFQSIKRAHSNASSTMDVDAIINAIDSDSDDDAADLAELDEMIARFSINVSKTSAERERNARTKIALPTNPASKWNNDKEQQQYFGVRNDDIENYAPTNQFTTTGNQIQGKQDLNNPTRRDGKVTHSGESNRNVRATSNANSNTINKFLHQYQSLAPSKSDVVSEAALKTAEEYERRLLRPGQRDIVSPLMVKRRMKPKIELQTKSRKAQVHAQTPSKKKMSGLNSAQHPRFNFSGMIESKCMNRLSAELQRNGPDSGEDVGLPTALSIGSKFIAVGTQRGIVLVFDLFEELRQELGLGAADIATLDQNGSVSSIDLAANGENLVAGYTNGSVIVWDVIKGTMVKAVTDLHPSPITVVRFISEKSLNVVSVDAGGLVNKLSFVKTMLWSTFNVESECLLDGSAGQILAMDVLAPMASLKTTPLCITDDKTNQPYHPSIHKLVLIALSSERSSFAIAVEPSVSVLHRWAKPSDEQINVSSYVSDTGDDDLDSNLPHIFLPCLSWGWALVSGGENSVTPILARGWGCYVQLLRANFPPIDKGIDGKTDDNIMHWPAFGVHDEFDVTAPVVALEWLGDRSLVILSLTNELIIVDTVMMTLVERLDFSGVKLVYAEFALSRSMAPEAKDKNHDGTCISTTFQNSIRSSEDRLLVLCPKEVKTLSILGIQQRLSVLEDGGEWLEALALALDHYEFTIKSQEDRRRNPDGSRDIADHPEFVSRIRLTEDEEWIGDLLLRYLTLAVDNAPESTEDTRRKNRIDLARSHYSMLAGVCIEFCVITRRLDLLFNEIYQCFSSSGYTAVFLDILEPYVLNDKLKYIAPVVMSEFISYYKSLDDIAVVERCLLHMDVTIMDFDSILTLLRKNSMFSALIHVYTQGLDDYLSPLQILFDAFFDAAESAYNPSGERVQGSRFGSFEKFGFKIILYLRHCFTKKRFPTGKDITPEDRIITMRPELLQFLIQKQYQPISKATSNLTSSMQKKYPYIHMLMKLDSKSFCDTLSIVFDDQDVRFFESSDTQDTLEAWLESEQPLGAPIDNKSICPDRMNYVRRMAYVLSDDSDGVPLKDTNPEAFDNFSDFIVKYLLVGAVRAPPSIICSVISRLSSRLAEDEIIRLLQVLPRNSYKRESVLSLVEASQMSRAALILHKGGVSEVFEGGIDPVSCSKHFMSAIDCYLKDGDPRFQRDVFEYIKNECIGGSTAIVSYDKHGNEETTVHDILRNALCEKLPKLINLDPVPCAQLVAEIYVEELEKILTSLEKSRDEMVQFKFFHAIISGNLTKVDAVAGPVLLANMTIDHHQKYLELMAKFYPDMVYHHLISSDNYKVEECLKLCQEYEIADASAYLLERMGNVSSALQLMLQTLEGRLMMLKRVVRGLSLSPYGTKGRLQFIRNKVDTHKMVAKLHQEKESQAVQQILTFGLDLCERNSGASSQHEHGSQLWFNVLDRLINAKGFLRLTKELPEHSTIMLNVLSDLLRTTMQRMVSNVPLPDLVRKITIDHAGNRLGEFRELITTMLNTYISEMNVCKGAVTAMYSDVHDMSASKLKLMIRGTKVHDISPDKHLNIKPGAGTLLHINSKGNVSVADDGTMFGGSRSSFRTKSKTSAISRLRSKRQKKAAIKAGNVGQLKVRHGMMPKSDKLFQLGESSDAAFMSRCIGMLSEAEHFGRLRYV